MFPRNYFPGGPAAGGEAGDPGTITVSVVNNEDGTATFTVAGVDGGTTVTLWTRLLYGAAWVSTGSRTGDGTIANVAMINGLYLAYINGTSNGSYQVSAVIGPFRVSDAEASGPATFVKVEESIVNRLMEDSRVSALVGSHIYPLKAPQKYKGACIIYQRIDTERTHHLLGPDGLANVSLQLTCWGAGSNVYTNSKEIADAVRLCLDGFIGTIGDVYLDYVRLASENDTAATPADGSERMDVGVVMDFSIWHQEQIET